VKFTASRVAITLWLIFILGCSAIITRSHFTADLSAFLPRSPTPAQQLLLEQIHDGLASRLILVGIKGADAPARARISKQLAQQLRQNSQFVSVNNGEPVTAEQDRAYWFNHRYLLSATVTADRFTTAGLHNAISDSIDLLASPAGLLVKSMLPHDPTGEMVELLTQFSNSKPPALRDGAWISHDGSRALLLIQTRASGADTDAQQLAMTQIEQAYQLAAGTQATTQLEMTGPGVFSVKSRNTIKAQVTLLSIISVGLIAALLLLVYRSPTALILGFMPVISGALAGIAAVSLGFGTVHGITLGFGTALIGEAVDYSIYLFVQSERRQHELWVKRYWPTIRLGVLTSIAGFASLLFSGFPGLAQLGLYSIAGLITAAAVTRYVLPHLLPDNFRIHDVTGIGLKLSRLEQSATKLRWPAVGMLLLALAIVAKNHDHIWDDKIASLSPVSQADIALDTQLRADSGAPDVRYLVVISETTQEAVLRSSEQVADILQKQVEQWELASFDSPSHYLPSTASQQARLASLPTATQLQANLENAVLGLPIQATRLTPFLTDVASARTQPLLQLSDLHGTSMAMAVDALLIHHGNDWRALLPLTALPNTEINAAHIRAALHGLPNVILVDMKQESNQLYSSYLHEAILLSLGGLVAVIALLLIVFHSPARVLRILAPLAAAVITVTAGLTLLGHALTILHLIGLLLVVAIGSNYALFFDRNTNTPAIAPRTLASMFFANLTTVAGFGLLAFSDVSILQAMGMTVAPGVILALIYSAIFARATHAEN
jgi:predicted exporter